MERVCDPTHRPACYSCSKRQEGGVSCTTTIIITLLMKVEEIDLIFVKMVQQCASGGFPREEECARAHLAKLPVARERRSLVQPVCSEFSGEGESLRMISSVRSVSKLDGIAWC